MKISKKIISGLACAAILLSVSSYAFASSRVFFSGRIETRQCVASGSIDNNKAVAKFAANKISGVQTHPDSDYDCKILMKVYKGDKLITTSYGGGTTQATAEYYDSATKIDCEFKFMDVHVASGVLYK